MQAQEDNLTDALADGHEPWVPPELAARLVVGARVRVRISGECRYITCCTEGQADHDALEGRTGRLVNPTWARMRGPVGTCEHCGKLGPVHGDYIVRLHKAESGRTGEARMPAAELEPL